MLTQKINKIFIVICVTGMVLSINWTTVEADEVPAFFLKIAKNIPRVGRSGRIDEYLLTKQSKNYPRANKVSEYSPSNEYLSYPGGNDPEIHKRMVNYPAPGNIDSISWEHFPLAIEGPPELWRTLASYANYKYGTASDDIDNEIWQRNKRKNVEN
ncbi:ecdysis triggering hormone isoform X1 [Cotesia typhae]|uniref:ecdysis triggering hormone isoform X1 n=1 Tax=Cotesia typhae TaxID=2053667 RepID=UPI003D6996F4